MPTVEEVASEECPKKDGVSLVPLLQGDSSGWPGHEYLYWEHGDAQAVRLEQWWATRTHPDRPLEVYEADGDAMQERDRAGDLPEVVARVEAIIRAAHEENVYFPAPGQPRDEWQAKLREMGIELTENLSNF